MTEEKPCYEKGVLDKFPYEISTGQCQRCACVRAITTFV